MKLSSLTPFSPLRTGYVTAGTSDCTLTLPVWVRQHDPAASETCHPVEQEPGVDPAVSWGPLTGILCVSQGGRQQAMCITSHSTETREGYLFNRSWYSQKHVASFIRIWNNPTQIIRDVRRLKVHLLYSVAMEIQVRIEVAWPGSRMQNWN